MRAITGDETCKYQYNRKSNSWQRLEMKVLKGQGGEGPDISFYHAKSQSSCSNDDMYKILAKYSG